ncbi:MAG: glycosyltransferase family 4 protein [Kiritimatiellia bacterium]|jgi:glycosyltransferase involved in cell wall biosynthesis|nr:glycosyltransferase family 4 protein [Kiritimatiellia bacterium]MDP7024888.1 glycosyltransferase family 4 protein [Kiritimatiellia bacterium]
MHHYSAALMAALKADDPACDVAYFGPQDTDPDVLEKSITTFTYPVPQTLDLAAFPRLVCLPWTAHRIAHDIRRWKPDLLHVNSGHVLYPVILGSLASQFPIVSTLHEVDSHLGERQFYRVIKIQSLLKNCRSFIVHDRQQKARMQEAWGVSEDRIGVVPLPRLDCLLHHPIAVARIPQRVLFFGRIYAYKGYDTMLRALPLIARSFPEVELVIAGEGDLSPWQALVEKAGRHVRVINAFIPDREMLALLKSSALAVAPYHEASQSGVVSLAMSAGLPVVASEVGTIPEMIRDGVTGRLVPPGDITALAEAIVDMLSHPEQTERLGQAFRRDGEERFSARAIGSKLRAAYDRVAKCQAANSEPQGIIDLTD